MIRESLATGWAIGVRIHDRGNDFSLRHYVQTGSGLTPRVKRPEREADHSPPCVAEVKNTWSYTLFSFERLHGVVFN